VKRSFYLTLGCRAVEDDGGFRYAFRELASVTIRIVSARVAATEKLASTLSS
jgi:hypothetical protein